MDFISQDPKKDPNTQDSKENPITQEPKEDPKDEAIVAPWCSGYHYCTTLFN